jgi:molybdenum cofactor guanylyltransferase
MCRYNMPEFQSSIPLPTLALIINAGGQSRRMGQDKALMPVPGSNQPIIHHIAQRLNPLIDDRLIVVTNNPAVTKALAPFQPQLQDLPDAFPDTGPLGGLATGLALCSQWAICVACDMPLVQPAVFQYLHRLAGERNNQGREHWDAVVPLVADRYQTHHALYHRRCLPAIHACLQTRRHKVDEFYPAVRLRVVDEINLRPLDPDLLSFFNANTPDEWAVAERLLQQERR